MIGMIRRFSVNNFGPFPLGFTFIADDSSDSNNRCSMIIARNNSGKSSFIAAFRLLQNLILQKEAVDSKIKNYINKDAEVPDYLSFNIVLDLNVKDNDPIVLDYTISINLRNFAIIEEKLDVVDHPHSSSYITTEKNIRSVTFNGYKQLKFRPSNQTIIKMLLGDEFSATGTRSYFDSYLKNNDCSFDPYLYSALRSLVDAFQNIYLLSPNENVLGSVNPDALTKYFNSMDLGMELRVVKEPDNSDTIRRIWDAFYQNKSHQEMELLRSGRKIKEFNMMVDRVMYYGSISDGKLKASHIEMKIDDDWRDVRVCDLSSGIQRLVTLYSMISDQRAGITYIIDEIDRKLHTNLTLKIIQMFLSNKNRCQLIFTSHETELLNSDWIDYNNLWIIDKSEGDGSYLYACPRVLVDSDLKQMYIENKLI